MSARTVAASSDAGAIRSEIERCHRALGSPSNVIAPPGDDAARLMALARAVDAVGAASIEGEPATARLEEILAGWCGVRPASGAPYIDARMLLVDAIHFVADGRPYRYENKAEPFPQRHHAETVVRLIRAHQTGAGERLGGEAVLPAICTALRLSKRKPNQHNANGFWPQIKRICDIAGLGRVTAESLGAEHGAWKSRRGKSRV